MALSSADKQARNRFQSGLLAWLRAAAGDAPTGAAGLREMIAVVRGRIEDDAANILLWRSGEAFLNALLEGNLPTDEAARQLCRRIERQLGGRGEAAATLGDAIFSFVSNRGDAGGVGTAEPPPTAAPGVDQSLRGTLGAAADLLPLMTPKSRRFSEEQHARWQDLARRLADDWYAQQTAGGTSCRGNATRLVALSLELNDAAALRLAEAIADAAGACEERSRLESAVLRAAFSAALEVLAAPEGPEQAAFDDKAEQLARRLQQALATERPTSILAPGAPWFAEDAHEWLDELRAALEAVPPQRETLVSGFEWLAQQDEAGGMAVRGLAMLAGKVVRQMRSDDLDTPEHHRLLGETLDALAVGIDEQAAGLPPRPDEAVFAGLREIERDLVRQRGNRRSDPAPEPAGSERSEEAAAAGATEPADAKQDPLGEG